MHCFKGRLIAYGAPVGFTRYVRLQGRVSSMVNVSQPQQSCNRCLEKQNKELHDCRVLCKGPLDVVDAARLFFTHGS